MLKLSNIKKCQNCQNLSKLSKFIRFAPSRVCVLGVCVCTVLIFLWLFLILSMEVGTTVLAPNKFDVFPGTEKVGPICPTFITSKSHFFQSGSRCLKVLNPFGINLGKIHMRFQLNFGTLLLLGEPSTWIFGKTWSFGPTGLTWDLGLGQTPSPPAPSQAGWSKRPSFFKYPSWRPPPPEYSWNQKRRDK